MPTPLDWPNCLNVRDLGGLRTTDGRVTRHGALIRSDNLDRLTDAGIAALHSSGVGRIIDVRTRSEATTYPSPFAGSGLYYHLPLYEDDDPYDPSLSLAANYCAMLDRRPNRFALALGAIADAPARAVVVHCHAGKDRSGIVVALALSLARATPESVVADYATVDDRLQGWFGGQLGHVEDEIERRQLAESFAARPETMVTVLRHLADAFGGIESYLRYGGMTSAQIRGLRGRLVA